MTFGEEDLDIYRRREAAMAATPLLQPNFKSASISDQQLQKLKELRRRRLQTKNLSANSNMKIGKKNTEKKSGSVLHDKVDIMQNQDDKNILSGESHQGATNGNFEETNKGQQISVPWKKRKMLHWGLDTKERWERKGNM